MVHTVHIVMTTSNDRRLYVTIRDPQNGRSKTITVRGPGINASTVIKMILDAVRSDRRKAG